MARYICDRCSHVYDESNGDPWFGINPNTKFIELPEDWICCDCAADKKSFVKITDQDKVLGNFFRIVDIKVFPK
jgi:rubredoxin